MVENNSNRLFEVMRRVNNLNENVLPVERKNEIIEEFVAYVLDYLELKIRPKIIITYKDGIAANQLSFGKFMSYEDTIEIVGKNRNLADILRTLAHEIVHFKQKLNSELNINSGEDGSEQENEANSMAAVIMRKFGKKYPLIFE